jgi:LPXTG-motif cell wall-anchored protein
LMNKYIRLNVQRASIALLAIAVLMGSSVFLPVLAQTTATVGPGNGFRVSPVREELTIQPGKNEVVNIAVENITNESIVARPVVNDFVASDSEDGQPRLLLDDSTPTSGNSFKSLVGSVPDVPLKAHERKTIKVTVNVPANASGGGYYGALRFSPSDGGAQKQVALTASVGVLFLVKVPGQIIEKLDLLTLSACETKITSKPATKIEIEPCKKPATLFGSSPNDILIRLKNPGTIHLQPNGRLRVKNWRGKVLSDQEFNGIDPRGNVLPNSTRHFDNILLSDIKDEKGNFILAKANFGRYTIEANLGYGTGGGDLIIAKAVFCVIPTWFMILIGIVLLGIVGGVVYWRRRRHKQKRYR